MDVIAAPGAHSPPPPKGITVGTVFVVSPHREQHKEEPSNLGRREPPNMIQQRGQVGPERPERALAPTSGEDQSAWHRSGSTFRQVREDLHGGVDLEGAPPGRDVRGEGRHHLPPPHGIGELPEEGRVEGAPQVPSLPLGGPDEAIGQVRRRWGEEVGHGPAIASEGVADQVRGDPPPRSLGAEDGPDGWPVVRSYGTAEEEPHVRGAVLGRLGRPDGGEEGCRQVRPVLHPLREGLQHKTLGVGPPQGHGRPVATASGTSAPPPPSPPLGCTGAGAAVSYSPSSVLLLQATGPPEADVAEGLDNLPAEGGG